MDRTFPTLTAHPICGSARGAVRLGPGPSPVLDRDGATVLQRYPHARVIVLDDDVNTFQHVVDVLRRYIPGMSEEKAWALANRIDSQGSAEVWSGPLEQAEMYHQQLAAEGLTMAPLERN
ncbi:ATP-dependent Clp protease adapter ClpS [Synechococcus sp. RSCCF101]|uniref:ATP-dependent Clp protease adapter ClpS n=1 Tax=Synechococcus sp. RSCCF101 TaxID=2511069 RepID=UPI0012469FDB|nr:ATP-dependent Clp protease adapter ClpS [Synechococcus sp. RSCCF101]QEY31668.1 ATP-dependent Clp protease adapter ClpS [Synechococcus sp. RSCCF101]